MDIFEELRQHLMLLEEVLMDMSPEQRYEYCNKNTIDIILEEKTYNLPINADVTSQLIYMTKNV